ncbi:MAG TPA: transposase [Vicinamibacterales bacterium]|nr:transposase [Vicinamibacterales bacterium]
MLENRELSASVKASTDRPSVTRGLRRQQEKLRRKRERVPADTLVVGVDLARERQAVSFVAGHEVLGRRRVSCEPHQLDQVLGEAEQFAARRGSSGIVVAFEPAGHYWCLAAEAFERAGTPYVMVQPISVKRAREESRYTPEKTDPRDADLIGQLATQGRFTEMRLPASHEEDAAWQLARDYFRVRNLAAAERTRLHNFWHRMLPAFFSVFRDPACKTALAIGCALLPLSELGALSSKRWIARVRSAAQGAPVLLTRAASLLPLLKAAHRDPARRSGEGMPFRIRHAAERRRLLEGQKAVLRAELLERCCRREEAALLDSIPGSNPFYNALTLALVGDFERYDDPRAIVKLAGSEVNQYASGDWTGTSRISHRGRSALRAAAYPKPLLHPDPPHHETEAGHAGSLRGWMNSYLRIVHSLVTRREAYSPLGERTCALMT